MTTAMPVSETLIADRYRLTEELGRGGMGVVWAGFDELLHRSVAIKEVHFPGGLSAEDAERLAGRTWREARAVAAVDTPAAVKVFDVVEHDGRPWIVMELVSGTTLTERLRERGALPDSEVARIGLALLDALDAAHAAGVLHRDVKPSNVLIGYDGRIALTDFGIATVDGDHSAGNTTSGVVLGSPAYVAPERLQGQTPTAAADLWSLGATLWTASEGRPPYEGPTIFAVMNSVATLDPPSCSRCNEPLADLMRRLMDRDPARRPTAHEARSTLERVAADRGASPAPKPPSPTMELPIGFDRTTILDGAAPAAVVPPVAAAQPAGGDRPVAAQASPAEQPSAAPGGRRASRLPLALALIAVAAAAAVAVVLATRGDGSHPRASTDSREGHHSASQSAVSLPSDWTKYRDPDLGWRVGVPPGWTRSVRSNGTMFSDPAGGRYFLIATRYPAGSSAVGAWQDSERSFRASHAAYSRIRLESTNVDGAKDAADWEFTYSEGGASLHALDHAIVVGNRGYAVYVQSHTDQWDASQALFDHVIASFRPHRSGT
jgi:hypothetical protein